MSIDFQQASLPNGLTIIGECSPEAHTAAIGFYVKTGARDETPDVMGVSHFLEHMMFKGSETRSAEDVDRHFDEIGAVHNAFTSGEMTAFWAHCLPDQLPRATEILADILRPSLRDKDFDDEKSVILEEIAMYADQPFWVLYERTMENYYGAHPLGHRVLGTTQTVSDLSRDQMLDYFTERYSADNTVVALGGRFDFDASVDQIRQGCAAWNTSRTQRKYPQVNHQADSFTDTSSTVHRSYTLMLAPAPAADDDRRYAASILTQILGDVEGSRLYWALVETGLAEEAAAQYDGRDGLGEYMLYSVCDPKRQEEVEQIMLREIESLIESLTDDDLQRVRSMIATSSTLHSELPAGRMRRLGRLWIYRGEYRSLEEELERINAVSLDDLRDLWESFPIRPIVTGRLNPE